MPIPIDKFEIVRNKRTLILSFLYTNKQNAYTLKEIKEALKYEHPDIKIGQTLYGLKSANLVNKERIGEHNYFAISEYGIKIVEQNK